MTNYIVSSTVARTASVTWAMESRTTVTASQTDLVNVPANTVNGYQSQFIKYIETNWPPNDMHDDSDIRDTHKRLLNSRFNFHQCQEQINEYGDPYIYFTDYAQKRETPAEMDVVAATTPTSTQSLSLPSQASSLASTSPPTHQLSHDRNKHRQFERIMATHTLHRNNGRGKPNYMHDADFKFCLNHVS